jgi:hypothetical protein
VNSLIFATMMGSWPGSPAGPWQDGQQLGRFGQRGQRHDADGLEARKQVAGPVLSAGQQGTMLGWLRIR